MPINRVFTQNINSVRKYIKSQPREILESSFPLASLDMKKVEGIQKGIPILKGVSMPEVKFLTKWFEALPQSRGCGSGCGHCLRDAQPAIKNGLWDDFSGFINGFKALNERLGFNLFKGNKYVVMFDDSNLPILKSLDKNGNSHNIAEATKLIYENFNIPTSFATASWNRNDAYTQNAAKELVEYLQKKPDAASGFAVSINPFHRLIKNSIEAAKAGKPELARNYRGAYIDNTANALNTFLPMYENGKGSLLYRHANNLDKNVGFREKETAQLYEEIFKKLKQLSGKNLGHIDVLNPKEVTKFDPNHLIEPKGRAKQYFSDTDNFKKYLDLQEERMNWEDLSSEQKAQNAYDYTIKGVDINGQVYLTTPSENVIMTDLRLNYENKHTIPFYSDVKLSPVSKEEIKKL